MHPDMTIVVDEGGDSRRAPLRAARTTARCTVSRAPSIANMVEGVTNGFTKTLEIVGVGYKAEPKGKGIILNLGLHPHHRVHAVGWREARVPQPDHHRDLGIGQGRRSARPRPRSATSGRPEPYKGKGIRYQGEQVRRKAGKTAGA